MNYRSLGVVSGLLLTVTPFAQEAKVTLEFRCAPLRNVLREVSRQTGVHLEAGNLGDRPIMVQATGMTPKAFYDAVAKVLDAEWQRSGDGFVLSREGSRQRLAESREVEMKTPLVAKAVGEYLSKNAGATDWSDAAIDKRLREDAEKRKQLPEKLEAGMVLEIMDNMTTTPATMVLAEAVRKIPARTIAGVLPGQRLVLSSAPNRMQKPLPYVPSTLGDYVRAYNRLAAASKAQARDETPGVRIQTPLSRGRNSIDRVTETLVSIDATSSGYNVSLTMVDANGDILDRVMAWLGDPPPAPGEVPSGVTGEVELSALAKGVLKILTPAEIRNVSRASFSIAIAMDGGLMGRLGNDPSRPDLTVDVRAAIADPATRDPYENFPSEVFSALAKQRGKDFVAALPDYAFVPLGRKCENGKLRLADLYAALPALKLTIDEGEAVLVYASNQAEAYRSRVNRDELSRLIKSDAAKGYLMLDELCRYTLSMPRWSPNNLDATLLKVLVPAAYQEYDMGRNNFLKLYATLTPAQRLANQQRSLIPLAQMSTQQRGIIEEIVYSGGGAMIMGAGMMMTATVESGGPAQGNREREPAIAMMEPTEAFPNGVPAATVLQLSRSVQEGVFAYDAKGYGVMLSAGDLGMRQGFTAPPGMQMTMQKNFSRYSLAELTRIDLTLQFGRRSRGADNLMDARIKDAAKVAFDQLPEAFKQNVDRARQRAANMRMMTAPGGPNKPPNP